MGSEGGYVPADGDPRARHHSEDAALVVSDGVEARIGALGAGREWFKPWRTITGREVAPTHLAELQVVLEGVFEHRRFLDLIRYFVVFEDAGGGNLNKKVAGYHQFHAVNVAIEETLRATQSRRVLEGARLTPILVTEDIGPWCNRQHCDERRSAVVFAPPPCEPFTACDSFGTEA